MQNKISFFKITLLALLLFDTFIHADTEFPAQAEEQGVIEGKDWVVLPFAFSSETTGVAGGIGAIKQGLLQPQTTLVTSIFGGLSEEVVATGGKEEAKFRGAFLYFSDYKLPFNNRTFFSIIALKSYYPNTLYYIDGSNDSDRDDVFRTSGDSDFVNTKFTYVLPMGEGIDNPQGLYTLRNGFCVGREDCGGNAPFVTGHTSMGIKTFYQTDTSDYDSRPELTSWNTNGVRFFLKHDNTDFDLNPSRGYHFELQYSKDFGKGESLQSWDFLEFKYNHYVNLDIFSFTQQNVLALSVWTGHSFSWDNDNEIAEGINAHRPPMWEGARLGGFFKMRAYDNNRFSDKAAFYATAEYRAVLDWNPLKNNTLVPVAVDWFQVVAFAEAGRVNDRYSLDLVSDMKYDAGLSLRALAAQLPVRLDVAYGQEGWNMWLMINQPFDF